MKWGEPGDKMDECSRGRLRAFRGAFNQLESAQIPRQDMSDNVMDIIAEMYPDTLKADGYDDYILGVADRDGETVIVYSSSKIIEKLMSNDGMDNVEAQEWFEYNIYQVPSWDLKHQFT